MWTILSGIVGGVLRLVPEFFKYLDKKNERAHEILMQDKMIAFQELKGNQKIDELNVMGDNAWDAGALAALKTAIQGQDTPSGVRWIDGLSKLIRPLITLQWVVLLYPAVIIATFFLAINGGTEPLKALVGCFGESEKALVSFIVDFWFVGRILDRTKRY